MPDQLRCFACGAVWNQRGDKPPIRCPRCQSRKYYTPPNLTPLLQRPRNTPPKPQDAEIEAFDPQSIPLPGQNNTPEGGTP